MKHVFSGLVFSLFSTSALGLELPVDAGLLAAAVGDSKERQFNVAQMYERGVGMPQDYGDAAHWYRLAAEQGYAPAQVALGLLHVFGNGVPVDHDEALRLFRLAADQGNARGQNALGVMYAKGFGVTADPVRAHMWTHIAAYNGLVSARNLRNSLAQHMTSDEITEAQLLARVCLESAYQQC